MATAPSPLQDTAPDDRPAEPALPVGEVADANWQEWEDSVAFQDSQFSEFPLDDDSLMGDANAIVVEIKPGDTDHFDPFSPLATPKK